MKEFIAFFGELMLVVAVSGMLLAMAPEGAQKKYIHFAISLSVLCALIGPMLSVVSALPNVLEEADLSVESEHEEIEGNLEETVIKMSRGNIEDALKQMISQKFELLEEDIEVEVILDAEEPSSIEIVSVHVSVRGLTHIKREEMRKYLSEILMDHCRILISEL